MGALDVVTLPETTLRRALTMRVVSGRVVDRDGEAVAGARVFQAGDGPRRTESKTDNDGRFRLPGVYSGLALVFVEKAGFRFGGAVAGPKDSPVEIRIVRDGEKPTADLKSLPSPLSRAEERALARELIEPVVIAAREGSGQNVMPALARLDPARVLTMLDQRVITQPKAVLPQIALGQFEDDPSEAIATIESDLDPASRAWGFLALAGAVPVNEPARRDELLDRAFAEARKSLGPDARMPLFGEIADRWLTVGERDKASAVLRCLLRDGKVRRGPRHDRPSRRASHPRSEGHEQRSLPRRRERPPPPGRSGGADRGRGPCRGGASAGRLQSGPEHR